MYKVSQICFDQTSLSHRFTQRFPSAPPWEGYRVLRRHVAKVEASRQSSQIESEIQYIQECGPKILVKALALVASGFVTGSFISILVRPVGSYDNFVQQISTAEAHQQQTESTLQKNSVFEVAQNFSRASNQQRPETEEGSKKGRLSVKEQVADIQRLNNQAKTANDQQNYKQALEAYTEITRKYPDLAITNYARINRALLLYQTGSKSQAILELEDLESSLRGYAEVHAAIASIIYNERPSEISYAEEQFDLASEFDKRYMDVEWVSKEKKWPPAMIAALDRFANLKS